MDSLDEIALRVSQCRDCSLHSGRIKTVPGEGIESAEIMLIGEGPGAREDQEGKPFVGSAGQFLEQLFNKNHRYTLRNHTITFHLSKSKTPIS